MISKKMGRRNFIKGASTALVGLASAPFWHIDSSIAAETAKTAIPKFRTLGKTGLNVATVSVGVMNCSDPAVLLRAFDLGINFYDTAHGYQGGRNEELVGKVFKDKRKDILIQTKTRLTVTLKEHISMFETSLKRLQTDHVDVLLAHNLTKPDEVFKPETMEFLSKMKKEGKTRFIGFSTHHDMAALLREAVKTPFHDVVLTSYNFTHSSDLKDAVAAAANAGIGIVAMKTQAGGYKTEDMGGLSPHQAALKYVVNDPHVACAIPGVTTIDQIEECAAVMGTAVSRDDLDELKQYRAFLHGRTCTMCGACTGKCLQGVAHTDLLRIGMYNDGYKNPKLVEETLRSEGTLRQMAQCSSCSSCSIICSRGLNIQAQISAMYNRFS